MLYYRLHFLTSVSMLLTAHYTLTFGIHIVTIFKMKRLFSCNWRFFEMYSPYLDSNICPPSPPLRTRLLSGKRDTGAALINTAYYHLGCEHKRDSRHTGGSSNSATKTFPLWRMVHMCTHVWNPNRDLTSQKPPLTGKYLLF